MDGGRSFLANDPDFVDWSSWVPDWVKGEGRVDYWVEVVDGLGAESVRRAAEEWWTQQVVNKPKSKGKGKGKTSSKQSGKQQKAGKSSRVR